ncbi:hypothetical protein F5Y16DRAFT_201554 [Xylariaceae sp. FL0255]|nr:hypothetical protein F5Y16DRAFT_201554 [Xylariaceae sp. FL0255]
MCHYQTVLHRCGHTKDLEDLKLCAKVYRFRRQCTTKQCSTIIISDKEGGCRREKCRWDHRSWLCCVCRTLHDTDRVSCSCIEKHDHGQHTERCQNCIPLWRYPPPDGPPKFEIENLPADDHPLKWDCAYETLRLEDENWEGEDDGYPYVSTKRKCDEFEDEDSSIVAKKRKCEEFRTEDSSIVPKKRNHREDGDEDYFPFPEKRQEKSAKPQLWTFRRSRFCDIPTADDAISPVPTMCMTRWETFRCGHSLEVSYWCPRAHARGSMCKGRRTTGGELYQSTKGCSRDDCKWDKHWWRCCFCRTVSEDDAVQCLTCSEQSIHCERCERCTQEGLVPW